MTHHIRIGAEVPPPVSDGEVTLLMNNILKRTDFGAPRQCTAQTRNAFAIEPSAGKQKRRVQHILGCPGISLRTRSMVRSAIRVPSYSRADDEYSIKTRDSRWPRIMSVGLWLLGVKVSVDRNPGRDGNAS